jgi:hypothetical protein
MSGSHVQRKSHAGARGGRGDEGSEHLPAEHPALVVALGVAAVDTTDDVGTNCRNYRATLMPGRSCTLCQHPSRGEIDKALVRGETLRGIAAQFGTSTGTLQRHKVDHLPVILAEEARQAAEVADTEIVDYAADVLRDLIDTRADARQGAKNALSEGRFAGAGALLAVRLKANELLAELEGRLNRTPQVNVLVQIRDALADLPPEMRAVIADRLDRIEAHGPAA